MDEQSFVTLCPNCGTQFRVTKGQLKVANGQVRCGACLTVFNAIQHQKQADKPKQNAPLHSRETKSTRASNEKLKTHVKPQPASQTQKQSPTKHSNNPVTSQPIKSSNTKKSTQPVAKPQETPSPKKTKNEPVQSDTSHRLVTNAPSDTFSQIPTLEIKAEPLVLDHGVAQRQSFTIGWFSACLVALILLGTQYLWFNRADLYWTHWGQAILEPLCQNVPCNIQPRIDTAAINTQAFTINAHPTIEGAINVQVIIQNNADFIQPYPAITLSFSDLKGFVVAERVFQPHEYMDTARHNPLKMPLNTPVQFTLEVMSPGPRASSYELELIAPDL